MKMIKSCLRLAVALILLGFVTGRIGAADEISPLGIWEGKSDGEWKVQFTISKSEKSGYKVIYEWEENSGEPISKRTLENGQFKEDTLKADFIEIKFKKDGTALATGHFKEPRTASLKKKKETKK